MAESAIKKAITVLDMLSRDPETVRLAELRMKQILDERSMLEGAREEGKLEGKLEFAKNLLDILDDETIAEKSGLPIEEVKKLEVTALNNNDFMANCVKVSLVFYI